MSFSASLPIIVAGRFCSRRAKTNAGRSGILSTKNIAAGRSLNEKPKILAGKLFIADRTALSLADKSGKLKLVGGFLTVPSVIIKSERKAIPLWCTW